MIVAYLSLLSGTTRDRHFKPPAGNPISRFSQVVMASIRKMSLEVPRNGKGLYETGEGDDGSRKIRHTDDFRFLDRAAVITGDAVHTLNRGEIPDPWHLCTVTQVEEAKCILRLIPVWLCTVISSVIFVPMLALFVEQGAAMDTTRSGFHVPPASMTVFNIVSTFAFVILYSKLVVPAFVKLTKRDPKPHTELQRIGIGLAIAIVSLVIAGLVEQRRLRHAGSGETSSLSIFWQVPQYVLLGVSEASAYVAQMEFFTSQSPDGLKSIGVGLSMASLALGCYAFLLTLVTDMTTRKRGRGWVPPNLNDGHLDRFFLSAVLTLANLSIFAARAKRYKNIAMVKRDGTDEVAKL
ncbi:hypothetical protein ACJRO7_020216 [Eucalyptus globulus]|uniref:Uncharacterized protein n=1 Tax=Eucalyptus globulus TaxID=34317 RepID=A0ABD3KFZ2_EUCGL